MRRPLLGWLGANWNSSPTLVVENTVPPKTTPTNYTGGGLRILLLITCARRVTLGGAPRSQRPNEAPRLRPALAVGDRRVSNHPSPCPSSLRLHRQLPALPSQRCKTVYNLNHPERLYYYSLLLSCRPKLSVPPSSILRLTGRLWFL